MPCRITRRRRFSRFLAFHFSLAVIFLYKFKKFKVLYQKSCWGIFLHLIEKRWPASGGVLSTSVRTGSWRSSIFLPCREVRSSGRYLPAAHGCRPVGDRTWTVESATKTPGRGCCCCCWIFHGRRRRMKKKRPRELGRPPAVRPSTQRELMGEKPRRRRNPAASLPAVLYLWRFVSFEKKKERKEKKYVSYRVAFWITFPQTSYDTFLHL